jgi:alpha-tubulin suppressor-like RCC1 family protein
VRCWGDGSRGQLGGEMGRDAFQVASVSGVPPLVELASGIAYSCGRTGEGSVWCWGDNHLAQLGSAAPGPAPRELGRTTAEDKDPAPAPVLWPDQILEQLAEER